MSQDQQVAVSASSGSVKSSRIEAIDALRGFALLGMFAVHTLRIFNEDGSPTLTTMTAAGRSAATFALLAGVSIALMTGGQKLIRGKARGVASAGLAARAVVIFFIGLVLGAFVNEFGINLAVILPYYGLAFLLAIPMIGLRLKPLVAVAVVIGLTAPVVVHLLGLVFDDASHQQPIFSDIYKRPTELLEMLLVTGSYPVLALMTYMAAGLAIGRLDLASKKVALWLLGGGAILAAASWTIASVLLFQFGGLDELYRTTTMVSTQGEVTRATVLWWSQYETDTWWDLAQRVGHSYSSFDLAHTIGFSAAFLGGLLLAFRARVVRILLWPISAAGSMPLTVYSLQIFLLSFWGDTPAEEFLQWMVIRTLIFACLWKALFGKGPLERLTGLVVKAAKYGAKQRLA